MVFLMCCLTNINDNILVCIFNSSKDNAGQSALQQANLIQLNQQTKQEH